jgi:hypothetical protein
MRSHQQPRSDVQAGSDALDRAIDAALEKYAAVEPRVGLEQRILASMRSERDRIPVRSWWVWGAVGAVATLLIVVAALAWRPNKPTKTVAERPPSASIEAVARPSTRTGSIEPARTMNARSVHAKPRRNPPSAVADEPKLDQFPSPEPLTEEELALVRYVRQFPRDAVMVASAQEKFEQEVQQEGASGRQPTVNSIEEER